MPYKDLVVRREYGNRKQREYRKLYPEKYKATNRRLTDRRLALLNEIKTSTGCIDCGFNDHPVALVFDHRDPSLKLMNVSAMIRFSLDKLMIEVSKCDVRCMNCHSIRGYELGHFSIRH